MSNIPEELRQQLEAFLSERRESDGGYAEVRRGDVSELDQVLRSIIKAKFEADPDGDHPVDFWLIDRTRYESVHFREVPYGHHADEMDGKAADAHREQVLDAVLFNLQQASSRVDTEMRIRQHRRHQEEKANATFGKRIDIRCVESSKGDGVTVDKRYVTFQHSFWNEGVEYVRLVKDDNKDYPLYPVSQFELV